MIDKNMLLEYVRIVNEYVSNPSFTLSDEQRNIINLVNREASNNEELTKLLNELKYSNNKSAVVENYFNSKEDKKENEYEVISEVFGIDITNIEHKYLNNGKEIFCFYDANVGRNVILENNRNGVSLVEQLKEIQSQNQDYQTLDNEKNTQYMLEDKRLKENCELNIIPIEEVGEHLKQVGGLSIEDYYKLMFLVKNASFLGISYINIENLLGIDSDGKIYEVYRDSSYDFKIGEPNTARYNEEVIDTSDRIDQKYNSEEQNMSLQSDYEDKPEEKVENEIYFDGLDEDLQNKTIMFYDNPQLLDGLDRETREKWQVYIDAYKKKLEDEEKEINERQNSPKTKRYTKEQENYGYVNLLGLLFIIGLVVTMLSLIIILGK